MYMYINVKSIHLMTMHGRIDAQQSVKSIDIS